MPRAIGVGGGGQNDFETSTRLGSELPLRELYTHFATQIRAQGWTVDAESVGNFLATGSFAKTVESNIELLGILSVLEVAEDGFDLKFRLVRIGGSSPAGGDISNTPAAGIRRAP